MAAGPTRRLTPATRAQAEPIRASLVIVSGGPEGEELDLRGARAVLGRSPDADLRIDDPAISREHALFESTPDGHRVRDLDSTNGVFVNGSSVQHCDLKHGDRIELGPFTLCYLADEQAHEPRTFEVTE